ncbi:MAG: hypothetical protein ACT4OM_05865 [Actinomycetota bacterium]
MDGAGCAGLQILISNCRPVGAEYVDVHTPGIGRDACGPLFQRWIEPIIPILPALPLHPNVIGILGMTVKTLSTIARI